MPARHPFTDPSAEPQAALHGKVLYIEDVVPNRALVAAMLSTHPGVTLFHASTGAEGIRCVREQHPDWVLLDMHLPDMSGLQVVRELSAEIAERGLRITILTGDDLSMDILKAMSLGAFEYWVKPIERRVLETGLRRALGARGVPPSPPGRH